MVNYNLTFVDNSDIDTVDGTIRTSRTYAYRTNVQSIEKKSIIFDDYDKFQFIGFYNNGTWLGYLQNLNTSFFLSGSGFLGDFTEWNSDLIPSNATDFVIWVDNRLTPNVSESVFLTLKASYTTTPERGILKSRRDYLSFDGVDDYTFTNDSLFDLYSSNTTKEVEVDFSLQSYSSNDQYIMYANSTNNVRTYIYINSNVGILIDLGNSTLSTNFIPNLNQVYNIRVVHNNNNVTVYIDDNVVINNQSWTIATFTLNRGITLGRTYNGTLWGNINLYYYKITNNGTTFLEYDFSENSGTTLNDISGNNRDSTIYGAKWESEIPKVKTLDTIVTENLTYRDIFETGNLIPKDDYTNWFSLTNVTYLKTNERYVGYDAAGSVTSTGNNWVYYDQSYPLNKLFYFSATVKSPDSATFQLGTEYTANIETSVTENYQTYSSVSLTRSSSSFSRLTMGGDSGARFYVKDIFYIDLDIFTNTPTKERMDYYLQEYLLMVENGGSYNFGGIKGLYKGEPKYAPLFDGVSSYASVGNPSPISNNFNSVSVTAWVNFEKQKESITYIVHKNDSQFEGSSMYTLSVRENFLSFQIKNGRAVSSQTNTDNLWHYVVGTWDGTNVKLYVDNELVAQETYTDTVVNAGDLTIGSTTNLIDYRPFTGKIKDVRIFYREITAQERLDIYNGQVIGDELLYYEMTDGSGTTFTDLSGNNNDATLNGVQWVYDNEIQRVYKGSPSRYLSFDGVDDYVEIPGLVNWGQTELNNFQIEITFSRDNLVETQILGVVNVGSNALFITPTDNNIRFFLRDLNGDAYIYTLTNPNSILSNGSVNTYLFTFTNNVGTLSINGVNQSLSITVNTNPDNFANLQYGLILGAVNSRTEIGGFSNIDLYDFKIYNGSTLFLHYDMSEGSGNTLVDKVGNNDGTIYGATWKDDSIIYEK